MSVQGVLCPFPLGVNMSSVVPAKQSVTIKRCENETFGSKTLKNKTFDSWEMYLLLWPELPRGTLLTHLMHML